MASLGDGRPAKRAKHDEDGLVADGNEVVLFHLADPAAAVKGNLVDLTEPFAPDMCHQVFGDEEQVVGYSGLRVDVWLDPRFSTGAPALLKVRYTERQEPADDIPAAMAEWFGTEADGFITTDEAAFFSSMAGGATDDKQVEQLDASRMGELVRSEALGDGATLEVYHSTLASAPETAKKVHAALGPLAVFYIDGATLLDPEMDKEEEANWQLMLAVLRKPDGSGAVAGMATLYCCYAYPDRHRLRLSQLLVLPPYQRQGVGGAMLRCLYQVGERQEVGAVAYEDPVEQVQEMRHKVELAMLLQQPALQEAAAKAARVVSSLSSETAANGSASATATTNGQRRSNPLALPPQALQQAQRGTRVLAKQVRYVWEAVLYVLQPSLRSGKGLALLKQLVRSRVGGSAAASKRDAEGKCFSSIGGDSWMMAKGKGGAQAVSLNPMEAEEEAQQEAATAEEVSKRLEQLQALAEAADKNKENLAGS